MHKYFFIGDIGNTESKLCLYRNNKILRYVRLNTKNINTVYLTKKLSIFKKYNKFLSLVLISSVVPKVFKYFKIYFKKKKIKCFELKDLNIKKIINIKVNYNQVGSDRIANAISIMDNKNNYIVVDFGTATNFDVIVKNSYIGGVIAPGLQLSLDTLTKKASLIPSIQFNKLNNIISKNTKSAINAGFYFGYVGLIDNIINSIIKQSGLKFKVVLTGGLAPTFKNSLKFKAHIKKNLTINGVLKTAIQIR